jgi:hypothetical protein
MAPRSGRFIVYIRAHKYEEKAPIVPCGAELEEGVPFLSVVSQRDVAVLVPSNRSE